MKKQKMWGLLTAVLIVLVLAVCGCGNKKEDTVPATTEAKTETKEETTTETKEEAPEPNQGAEVVPSDAECVQITMTLLDKLQYVTKVGAGAIQVDRDVIYTSPEGYRYFQILEPEIQNFQDIYTLLYDNFTIGCIDNRWKFLYDPEGQTPFIILVQEEDLPTGLYLLDAGTGYMTYTPTGNITIEHLDEYHFIATVPFEHFGETLHLKMNIIQEDGTWKINGHDVE
ncbi:MAG: hypothetical protein IKZ95_00280 [Lachnospiraceae bacterium]|nr:hypothetical protein [Lachnospiraceae bacterium]